VQPLILPLYPNTFSEMDILTSLTNSVALEAATAEAPSAGYGEVKTTFTKQFAKSASDWNNLLKNGFAKARGYAGVTLGAIPSLKSLAAKYEKTPSKDALEVILAKDHSVADGRYIDNAWLQEAPDPVVKLTWDNAAIVSPKTAKSIGVYKEIAQLETDNAGRPEIGEAGRARAPMAEIKVGDTTLTIPVVIGYGQADYTISLPVGYGQACDDGRIHCAKKRLNSSLQVLRLPQLKISIQSHLLKSTTLCMVVLLPVKSRRWTARQKETTRSNLRRWGNKEWTPTFQKTSLSISQKTPRRMTSSVTRFTSGAWRSTLILVPAVMPV